MRVKRSHNKEGMLYNIFKVALAVSPKTKKPSDIKAMLSSQKNFCLPPSFRNTDHPGILSGFHHLFRSRMGEGDTDMRCLKMQYGSMEVVMWLFKVWLLQGVFCFSYFTKECTDSNTKPIQHLDNWQRLVETYTS